MERKANEPRTSFLGSGWSFPPEFVAESGQVRIVSDEEDIESSLKILFGTVVGERLFNPKYGLDMQHVLFEPVNTTLRTFLKDQVAIAILVYEPRIKMIDLKVESPDPAGGSLLIALEYEVRATNSRYNLVYPFYKSDSNEVRSTVGV